MEQFDLLQLIIPGIKIFSVIHNTNKTVCEIDLSSDFPIVIGDKQKGQKQLRFNRYGSVLADGRECLIFPDRETRTWEGYVTPVIFKKGDVVQAYAGENTRLIVIYSHFDMEEQIHYCFYSIGEDMQAKLSPYSRVEKIHKETGYLYCKSIFGRSAIGILEKQTIK